MCLQKYSLILHLTERPVPLVISKGALAAAQQSQNSRTCPLLMRAMQSPRARLEPRTGSVTLPAPALLLALSSRRHDLIELCADTGAKHLKGPGLWSR